MIHDVSRHFFPNIFGEVLQKFCYRVKMVLQKVSAGYKKTFRNPNNLTKKAQIHLKIIPRIHLLCYMMSSDIFSQHFNVRPSNFLLSGKNYHAIETEPVTIDISWAGWVDTVISVSTVFIQSNPRDVGSRGYPIFTHISVCLFIYARPHI